jgi:hypothetical protein
MKLVDLRLPDEAINLLDALKDRYPHHSGRPSRTSVIIHLLCSLTPSTRREAELQDSLRLWITQAGTGTPLPPT